MRLDAGHQTNFFKDFLRQVLRLIDDKYYFLAVGVLLDEEHVEHVEQLNLAFFEWFEAELRQYGLKKLCRRQLRLRHDGVNNVVIKFGEK